MRRAMEPFFAETRTEKIHVPCAAGGMVCLSPPYTGLSILVRFLLINAKFAFTGS
jgi:hypothetical protein